MTQSRCGWPSSRLRLAVCCLLFFGCLYTERSSGVSDFIERVPLRRRNTSNHQLETLGPQTFNTKQQKEEKEKEEEGGFLSSDDSLPAVSLVSEQQQEASLPKNPSALKNTSFLEVGLEAARKGAVHAARLAIRLSARPPAAAHGALPSAIRPSAQGAAAAPVSVQHKPPPSPSRAIDLLSKTREEREASVAAVRGGLVRRGSGLTGARRAGLDRLAQMYKEDAEARKQAVAPTPAAAPAAREKPAAAPAAPAAPAAREKPAPAAAAPAAPAAPAAAALPKPAAGGVETPQAKKHLVDILAARGITARQPSGGLAARRMQQEKEAKEKEKEGLTTTVKITKEEETAAAAKKKEEGEKEKKEKEEDAAAEAKRKEAAVGLAKLLGRKPGKKAVLPETEEMERMQRKDRELRMLRKSTEEELRKEAEEIFKEIDAKARASQKEPVQPPLPDLVKRVFVTEKGI
ncbi:hypothetical protein Emed_001203 [Eimeria media]